MTAGTASERYRVRSYELDPHGHLAMPALCNYLQESAALHARALGVAIDQLRAEDMTWFLWRLHVRVARLPAWGETVTVKTWPAELGKPYAIRDFRIADGEGQEIGVATSAWLLMDTSTQKLIRKMPETIRELHPDPPRRALDDRFRRLPPCSQARWARQLSVRRSDLDMNGHLNHVATIAAVLEAVPSEEAERLECVELEIELKAEGRYGDRTESRCQLEADKNSFLHALARRQGGDELARARSRWRDR